MRPAALFCLAALLQSLTIFHGLDLTDTGHALELAHLAVQVPPDPGTLAPEIFLSTYAGGLWLALWPGPSLLWGRLGGVLLYALTSVLVYGVLSSHFSRGRAFAMSLACCLVPTMRYGIDLIDYYTFPAFLVTLHLFLLDRTLKADRPVWGFLLGLSALPIVMARITMLVFAGYPLVVLVCLLLTGKRVRLNRSTWLAILAGFLLSGLLLALLAWDTGVGPLYAARVDSLLSAQSGHYTRSRMGTLYRNQLVSIVIKSCQLGIALLLLTLLDRAVSYGAARRTVLASTVLLPSLVLGALAILYGESDNIDRDAFSVLRYIVGGVYIFGVVLLLHHRELSERLCVLLVASLVAMTCTPLGSSAGLDKVFYGMWLALPLVLLAAWDLSDRVPSDFLALSRGLTLCVILVSGFFKSSAIYNDDLDWRRLSTPFTHPTLTGIRSTERRVSVVERMLAQIQQHSRPGDEILLTSSVPMLYYLAERKPALGNAWLMLDPLEKIQQRQALALERNRLPTLFGFVKANVYQRTWPDSPRLWPRADIEKQTYLLQEYEGRLGYHKVWEDEDFVLYER